MRATPEAVGGLDVVGTLFRDGGLICWDEDVGALSVVDVLERDDGPTAGLGVVITCDMLPEAGSNSPVGVLLVNVEVSFVDVWEPDAIVMLVNIVTEVDGVEESRVEVVVALRLVVAEMEVASVDEMFALENVSVDKVGDDVSVELTEMSVEE